MGQSPVEQKGLEITNRWRREIPDPDDDKRNNLQGDERVKNAQ
jgi:hypothetical protein